MSGGDLNDDWTPDVGQLARVIFRGLSYGKLIAARDVTDQATIDKARVKGLSVGWDLEVAYRRPAAAELSLVAQAEAAHVDNRSRIALDTTTAPAAEPDDAF